MLSILDRLVYFIGFSMTAKGRTKSSVKHQQILDAAIFQFITQGFHNTSVEAIAAVAEVSKQTIYSHFGSKQELFTAAIERKCQERQVSAEIFNTEQPVRKTLVTFAHRFAALIMDEEAIQVHSLCVSESQTYPEVAELFYRAGPEKVTALLTGYLERMNEKGELDINNVSDAADQLIFMMKGRAYYLAQLRLEDLREESNHGRYLESCIDLFLRGYTPR